MGHLFYFHCGWCKLWNTSLDYGLGLHFPEAEQDRYFKWKWTRMWTLPQPLSLPQDTLTLNGKLDTCLLLCWNILWTEENKICCLFFQDLTYLDITQMKEKRNEEKHTDTNIFSLGGNWKQEKRCENFWEQCSGGCRLPCTEVDSNISTLNLAYLTIWVGEVFSFNQQA